MSTTILVVEDDAPSLRLTRRTLSLEGYEVNCASTAAAARRSMEEQPPALVVMDIRLPDGNGIELLVWMRQRDALMRVPVVAFTASGMPADYGKVVAAGFDAIVLKPPQNDQALPQTVRLLLAKPRP